MPYFSFTLKKTRLYQHTLVKQHIKTKSIKQYNIPSLVRQIHRYLTRETSQSNTMYSCSSTQINWNNCWAWLCGCLSWQVLSHPKIVLLDKILQQYFVLGQKIVAIFCPRINIYSSLWGRFDLIYGNCSAFTICKWSWRKQLFFLHYRWCYLYFVTFAVATVVESIQGCYHSKH